MPRTSLTPIERAVLSTLAYTDQFQFPLSREEVWSRLIWLQAKKVSRAMVTKTLNTLSRKRKVVRLDDQYALRGKRQLFVVKKKRQHIAERKWRDVERFVAQTRRIPWLRAIFVTGSLAMNNTEIADDIDFMIVTAPKRVWITRLIIIVIAILAGKRRSWKEKKHQGWCLNLWIDRDHVGIPEENRGVYVAYEIAQAKPVFDRGKTVQFFYRRNAWVKTYLPHWKEVEWGRGESVRRSSLFSVPFFDMLDWWCWQLQRWYMQPHKTSERVTRSYAFFHPRDTERMIQNGWQKSLDSLYE